MWLSTRQSQLSGFSSDDQIQVNSNPTPVRDPLLSPLIKALIYSDKCPDLDVEYVVNNLM